MPDPSSAQSRFNELAHEFADRYRRGERPPLSEYVARCPELADEIRELFPALVVMEEFGSAGEPGAQHAPPGLSELPDRLGEYRLLREIGRGGMGVVYEAVQQPLGRHVALKLLPTHRLLSPNQLERFRREARAAANLHHTNIVPVFGVGESDGIHFYAMQFIRGQGLDSVLQEVKRLRGGAATADEAPPSEAALGLLTGEYEGPSSECPTATPTDPASRVLTDPTRHYYCGVARIGTQVADALQYAHQQGVLHRDIKPANLLLDAQGTVWVTDFGLAKSEGAEDLTSPGDIVGTLRYLPPERFRGESDARGDVYSLGLTLYELLALRPAFTASQRQQLIEKVLHDEPTPLRAIDQAVPRDLETVVLKAIAKDPCDRYATAGQLAEDLRAFLADRPIQARRSAVWERLWRLCRRNPVVASLVGVIQVFLLTSSLLAWGWYGGMNWARRAERDAREQLFHSLVDQARANRRGQHVGQRFDSLKALEQAAALAGELDLGDDARAVLRDEVIACLALPDLRVVKEWEGNQPGTQGMAFDPDYRHYARSDEDGSVRVLRVEDNQEVARFRGRPGAGPLRVTLEFSADGHHLSAWYGNRTVRPLYVWSLRDGRQTLHLPDAAAACALGPGSSAAVSLPAGGIVFYNLMTGQVVGHIDASAEALRFSPDGAALAAATRRPPETRVFEVATGKLRHRLLHRAGVSALAWRGDGETLATGCVDHNIYLWDARSGEQRAVLVGHKWEVADVTFSRRGDILASYSHDKTVRLWDTWTAGALLTVPFARWLGFGPGDRRVTTTLHGNQVRLWEWFAGEECLTLHEHPGEAFRTSVDRRGRVLTTAGQQGVCLWGVEGGRRLVCLPAPGLMAGVITPGGDALITYDQGQLRRWPVRREGGAAGERRSVGPPTLLLRLHPEGRDEAQSHLYWCGEAGDTLALLDRREVLRLVRVEAESAKEVASWDFPGVNFFSSTKDGRLIAAGTWQAGGVRVYDTRSRGLVKELGDRFGDAAFSPDGRWLVTSFGGTAHATARCQVWRVADWEAVHTFETYRTASPAPAMFSRDGRVLAVAHTMTDVLLLDPESGAALATLTARDPHLIASMEFSPDGSRLAVILGMGGIQLWDLRRVREKLAAMGLDWDLPAYPPAEAPQD